MADFTKASGNSMNGVNMIAVIRPNRVIHQKDKAGKETDKIAAQFVDIMVDNSTLSAEDIKVGKGQANPNLYSRAVTYQDKDGNSKQGFNNGIKFSVDQVEAIKAAGEGNSLTKEDGTIYVPFKADLMYLRENVVDKSGEVVKDEDGKPQKRNVGFLPNTKTLAASDFGQLTQERLDAQFENTKAVKSEKDKAAAGKTNEAEKTDETAKTTKKKRTTKKASKISEVAASAEAATPENEQPEMPF